jgi:predicted transcriptional regulator
VRRDTAERARPPYVSYRREASTDIAQVAQALSNGPRTDEEIAKTTSLPPDQVCIALDLLVAQGSAIETTRTLFRLTDNGNDIVKRADAAARKNKAA